MSEKSPIYKSDSTPSLEAFKNKPSARRFDDPEYIAPTPEEVKALRLAAGWNNRNIADIAGYPYNPKKGNNTLRRWQFPTAHKEYTAIPYAVWRLLLIEVGVVEP